MLLVWELLTAVGVPDYDAYSAWEEAGASTLMRRLKNVASVRRWRRSMAASISLDRPMRLLLRQDG